MEVDQLTLNQLTLYMRDGLVDRAGAGDRLVNLGRVSIIRVD